MKILKDTIIFALLIISVIGGVFLLLNLFVAYPVLGFAFVVLSWSFYIALVKNY